MHIPASAGDAGPLQGASGADEETRVGIGSPTVHSEVGPEFQPWNFEKVMTSPKNT